MTQEKLKLLANGVCSIADALDMQHDDILETLVDTYILTEEEFEEYENYRATV